jgi:hypothetical protein
VPEALAPPAEFNPYCRIAAPFHLILVLALLGFQAYWGTIHAAQWRTAPNPDRVARYTRLILQEWIVLAIVLLGVWLSRSSLLAVLGERWRSIPQLLRDLGIGVAFLFVSVLVLSIVGPIVGMKRDNSEVQFLLPQANREKLLWLIVALSAGVCEEAVYRGYLQRQFTALTKSIPVGILFSAMAFAMAHLYQGLPRASVILLGAVMSGALAHWRKTVRPGMFAHVLQDLLPLVIRH